MQILYQMILNVLYFNLYSSDLSLSNFHFSDNFLANVIGNENISYNLKIIVVYFSFILKEKKRIFL